MEKDELEIGVWYVGEGRFTGDIGLWTGTVFKGMTLSMGFWGDTTADYGDTGFTPIKKLNTTDNVATRNNVQD